MEVSKYLLTGMILQVGLQNLWTTDGYGSQFWMKLRKVKLIDQPFYKPCHLHRNFGSIGYNIIYMNPWTQLAKYKTISLFINHVTNHKPLKKVPGDRVFVAGGILWDFPLADNISSSRHPSVIPLWRIQKTLHPRRLTAVKSDHFTKFLHTSQYCLNK